MASEERVASPNDTQFMAMALSLAETGLGSVWPNPSVGCIIVKEGQVVGRGCTGRGGRPHAEGIALQNAGANAAGATAYLSLEPCNHWGQTAPCTEALLAAGITRAVIATEDPDPRVDGKGIAQLRAEGMEVSVGVMATEAQKLNEGFFSRIRTGLPLLTTFAADGTELEQVAKSYDACIMDFTSALKHGLPQSPSLRIIIDPALEIRNHPAMHTPSTVAPLWILTDAGSVDTVIGNAKLIGLPEQTSEQSLLAQCLPILGARGLTRVIAIGEAANKP